jgi:hypothetical protein
MKKYFYKKYLDFNKWIINKIRNIFWKKKIFIEEIKKKKMKLNIKLNSLLDIIKIIFSNNKIRYIKKTERKNNYKKNYLLRYKIIE